MNEKIEFLVKLRDGCQMVVDAAHEYLESLAPPEVKENEKAAAVHEATFTILKFEQQQGAKLGEFDVAYKANNLEAKWHQTAYNILRNSNATINSRHHGQDYAFSYWLYGESKINRQKLKPKT